MGLRPFIGKAYRFVTTERGYFQMSKELHFYRQAGNPVLMTALLFICSPEDEHFWECMNSADYTYVDQCVHFDTLYEWHQDRLLERQEADRHKYGTDMLCHDDWPVRPIERI